MIELTLSFDSTFYQLTRLIKPGSPKNYGLAVTDLPILKTNLSREPREKPEILSLPWPQKKMADRERF